MILALYIGDLCGVFWIWTFSNSGSASIEARSFEGLEGLELGAWVALYMPRESIQASADITHTHNVPVPWSVLETCARIL